MSTTLALLSLAVAPTLWPSMTDVERAAFVGSVADKCGVARSAFSWIGSGELRFRPDPAIKYEPAMCVVKKLADAKAVTRIGFISEPPKAEGRK